MKKKELTKFQSKSAQQLNKEIADLKNKIWDIKQDILKGKEKNVRKANVLKKSIAQLSTIKNAKPKDENLAKKEESK